MFVPGLPLTANCEHEDRVDLLDVSIQHDIATRSTSGHQLPCVGGYGPSNKRIVLKYIESLNDFPNTVRHIFNIVFRQMIEDAIEVNLDFRSQLDPGHLSEPVS